jgi:predicted PurR-regulated permease PerM
MFGKEKKSQELTISNETILRVIGFVIAAGLLVNFFASIRHPLTLIFVSLFLALALNPAVTWVSNKLKNKNRVKATAIAYVAVISVLIGFFILIFPPLISQTTDFIEDVPQILRDLEDGQGAVGEFVRRYNLQDQVIQVANDWAKDTSNITDQAVTTANRIVSNLVSIITVLILTFMMLVEGPRWMKLFWSQFPVKKREHGQELASKLYGVVTGYVNGQVLVAAIGALFAVTALFIATTIFGVTSVNPIAFGGIVFLFSLIPTVGVIISSSIVVIFSLFASVPLAITMLIFFIIYQQIENATIQPYIQSRANELTPLIVFVAAIVGIGFGGLLGAIIAIPLAGCAKVLIDDYVLEKQSTIKVDKLSK